MHRQTYDDGDEFEPRITPKPMAKPDGFAVPSVPEISLIFDKPITARNKNTHNPNSLVARSEKPMVLDNSIVNTKSISSNLDKHNSYAAWREQNFSSKKDTNAMHVLPSCKNTCNYDHIPQSPVALSPVPQLYIPQPCAPQSYTSQSHVPQLHVPQSHAPQTHAPRSHILQSHVRQSRSPHSPQSHSPQSYTSQSYAPQSKLQNDPMQKQQEQNKICNRQRKLVNARVNDETYEKSIKFRCPDTNESYNMEQEMQLSSSGNRHAPHNPLQRATCNITNHTARMSNSAVMNTPKQTEHLQMPHMGYPYPFQQFYTHGYQNRDVDNNETVKTLLQLINSQSEQIKTLQSQIDRLVRLQEESFRNRSTCSCSLSHANQMVGYQSINCNETTNTLNSSQAQSHNSTVKKAVDQNASIMGNKDVESFGKNRDDSKLEVALLEQQSKKAFVEQKVSIGVMTSFEFTVQNNPFLVDSEMHEKREVHGESSSINRRSIGNTQDTTELAKRYKNTIPCKPGAAQLENIFEDGESYKSSSQQQSSNFNASSSVKDSDRHTPKQSDLHNISNTLESSKVYQHLATSNHERTHEKMYIRTNGNFSEQEQDTREIWNASVDVASNFTDNVNYNKAEAINNTKDYTATDKEESNDKTNANRRDACLPATNYYHDHRNTECNPIVKQVKDIGDSMILSGGDLKVFERPPTPEPSIHVEMQEYTSDDESDKPKRTSKIGWTFYNNVLGQVNEILQNSGVAIDDREENNAKIARKTEQEDNVEGRTALNTVKAATLEQLRRLGISITENTEHKESNGNNKTLEFDSSFYPRLDCQANMTHATSVVNETNTSMHMKALALKYLSDEQLADIALHKQGSSSLKHLMLSNVQGTNMSFATMRYLERYQLLPGRNNAQIEDIGQACNEEVVKRNFKPVAEKINPALHRLPLVQTPGTTCPSRILDISALKRQPKLL